MDMTNFLQTTFSVDGITGHASYVLLIASMLMTRMSWLRLLAIGSGLLSIAYSLMIADHVSASWEVLFVAVNLGQLGLAAWRNRSVRFNQDERMFRETVVPSLDAWQLRRLLATGQWRQDPPGTTLI